MIRVKDISQKNDRTLSILWTDNKVQNLDVVKLRLKCPCAGCIDEWTHKPILKPEQIPESVRPVSIESVGSYAMKIAFNDGHSTGIYTYQMLRSLN